MLATVTTSNASLVNTYDRSGRTISPLRSQPAHPIAPAGEIDAAREQKADTVTLSPQGLDKSRQAQARDGAESSSAAPDTKDRQARSGAGQADGEELTVEDQKVVQQLKERDREVRAHEMAHLASAGQHARGGPTYTYQQGPDGRRYAIGGEVPIDVSEEKSPEETIEKMQAVKRAAMAPAEPSSTDRGIAAAAAALESKARQEMQTEQAEESPQQTATGEPAATDPTVQATSEGQAPQRRPTRSLDVLA
ncbi:hypothetical protein Despr_2294 [Desulfobulbus propionicus DSM 2032]|uniref:SprA-related family protein n=1 Tax=Desulfobulbus propionicus (strain ATCC 33891 / DSM 2032 / VKM B-1956 / 1pr3) TaxID=577650 RepID=A0A7U3YN51_DESPD|nr:putative metalloprotease CJM1_0395 family protein [Desulfobulbus propionicus]ADW18437.1 hypothetical protein Despr_2294 [Desulfobulbus propionicus DSM 2032]